MICKKRQNRHVEIIFKQVMTVVMILKKNIWLIKFATQYRYK